MTLTVNGQAVELASESSVAALVTHVGKAGIPCAVEVNKSVVRKRDHQTTLLREGDVVEIVTLVGGG